MPIELHFCKKRNAFLIKHRSGTFNRVVDALSRKSDLLTILNWEVTALESLKDSYYDESNF